MIGMPDITYMEDTDYTDLGDTIKVELKMIGGWIYVDTPIERRTVNFSQLRYDGFPRNILNYAINQHPNEKINIFVLKDAGISTSRSLNKIAIDANIKGFLRDLFVPVWGKYELQILTERNLKPAEVDALMYSLYD
jgi:hypothetical protein